MDRELKAKWIAALRSGEYKQTSGDYYSPKTGGYCCLGVLSCVKEGREMREESCSTLKKDEGNAELVSALISMNDSGKSFADIADFIEQNFHEDIPAAV